MCVKTLGKSGKSEIWLKKVGDPGNLIQCMMSRCIFFLCERVRHGAASQLHTQDKIPSMYHFFVKHQHHHHCHITITTISHTLDTFLSISCFSLKLSLTYFSCSSKLSLSPSSGFRASAAGRVFCVTVPREKVIWLPSTPEN